MNTNFFTQIHQLDFTGVMQLNIEKGEANNLIVSVMLRNEQCGDKAKNLIPPLTFNATPQDFDEGFFQQIATPIEKTSGLLVDMEKYMKQLDEVKRQSAMEKEKADKEKKEADSREKKYKDAMVKVDELEKEGKFKDAWMKVPNAKDFPEKADEIARRRTSLSDQFATPSLFATTEPTPVTSQLPENSSSSLIDELRADKYYL